MDLIISIDNSTVHMAGAVGRPVWVLLSFVADWRWLVGRQDSPWYPTARLFWQESAGDWESVIARVAAEFKAAAQGDLTRLAPLAGRPAGKPTADPGTAAPGSREK